MTTTAQQVSTHHRAAQTAMQQGDLRAAHQHCLAILKHDESFADAWFLCGVIAAHNGQMDKAVAILGNAIQLAPRSAEYRAELGKQLLATHDSGRALREAEAAWALTPVELPTLNTLGTLFSHLGEHTRALQCFEQAVQALQQRADSVPLSREWQAELFFNTAASRQFAGLFEEAEAAYEQAIELQPRLFKAHSALSTVRRQSATANHLERLESLRPVIASARDQLHLGHAIAKELEDLGRFDAAFSNLSWGKEVQAAEVGYSTAADADYFAGLRELFTADFLRRAEAGHATDEPIFIVGMPRTGTTLVEQILSSHSRVFAAGELQHFPQQANRTAGIASAQLPTLATLKAAASSDAASLGAAYLESTRPRTGQTPHFIDKLPLNFLLLGLIRCALPDAKLVCLRRDPMDTCLSNYRQLFAPNFPHYHYNYDLLDCGRYYIEFDRLIRHWHEAMPGAVLEVQYEALVENPEQTARKLLAHCQLDWEDQCLEFHRRATSVATPSSVQVRQGVYTSSVGRWRRYGASMEPLYQLLQEAGLYPAGPFPHR